MSAKLNKNKLSEKFMAMWNEEQPLEVLKKMFSGISQNSKENTCASVSFLIKLQPREISKNAFPYRKPPGDCFQSLKRIKNVG